jgi:hypothetical protein
VTLDEELLSEKSLWELLQLMNVSERRIFACDCVEHVMDIFEEAYPENDTVREVIELAQQYAHGEATYDEVASASVNVSVPSMKEGPNYVVTAAKHAAWSPPPDWDNKLGDWEGMDSAWETLSAAQKARLLEHKSQTAQQRERNWQRQHAMELLTNR